MDTAAGKIPRQVLGHGPAPLQQHGRGVVEGIEGTGILSLPAQLAQGASPAHLLRRPVKDDGGVLIGGADAAPAHAVIDVPQGLCRPVQLATQPRPGGAGRLCRLRPPHPLAAKEPPGQQAKQHRPRSSLQHQRLGKGLADRQQCRQSRQEKRQGRTAPAAPRPGACRQPRQTEPRREDPAAGPGAQVRRQSQAQARPGPRHRPLLIGGIGQQRTKQHPPDGQAQQLHLL